jgi:hypothetical protein
MALQLRSIEPGVARIARLLRLGTHIQENNFCFVIGNGGDNVASTIGKASGKP